VVIGTVARLLFLSPIGNDAKAAEGAVLGTAVRHSSRQMGKWANGANGQMVGKWGQPLNIKYCIADRMIFGFE
jgi:hypothetical protein